MPLVITLLRDIFFNNKNQYNADYTFFLLSTFGENYTNLMSKIAFVHGDLEDDLVYGDFPGVVIMRVMTRKGE